MAKNYSSKNWKMCKREHLVSFLPLVHREDVDLYHDAKADGGYMIYAEIHLWQGMR